MDVAGPGREQESDARPQNYLCGGKKREKNTKITHQWCWCGTRLQTQAPATGLWLLHVVKPRSSSPPFFWQDNHQHRHVFPTPAAPPVCHSGVPSRATKPHRHVHTALPSAAGEEKEKASVEDKPWRDPTAQNVGTDVLLNAFCSGHW